MKFKIGASIALCFQLWVICFGIGILQNGTAPDYIKGMWWGLILFNLIGGAININTIRR